MSQQQHHYDVGDKVYFWPSRAPGHEATVIEAEQSALNGKWRYQVEYEGLLGETTTQWVSELAVSRLW